MTSYKNTVWLAVALVLIAIPVGVFCYLESIPVDCDQFSCIGYVILFGPMFLLGILILLILLLVNTVMVINKQLKKKNE